MRSHERQKILAIGLDSAPPRLLFEEFRGKLPNLGEMMSSGYYAPLRTIHPPITIPAWMAMCTGKDAGQMGVYGFRTRKGHSYTEFSLSFAHAFAGVRKIWDVLFEQGKRSILVGVPPSYPPYPMGGEMVSCFLCPDDTREYTYPSSLKREIQSLVGQYAFDVAFRTEERDKLLSQAFEMTEKRLKVIEHLLRKEDWDFFLSVEIGVDRIQHAFWKYHDPQHPLYEPDHKYRDVILDYYRLLDDWIGRLLSTVDKNTTVLVVSDHGAKAMKGAFCINEWLIQKGYLVLNEYPEAIKRFEELDVDWPRTRAWGWGGYYGRIFINREGREAQGTVKPDEYEPLRDQLIGELEEERDKCGSRWNTSVYRPQDLYESPRGELPDLMAYFDDLAYRSAGTVGHRNLFLDENDTGPDDAVHDWDGVLIAWQKGRRPELGTPPDHPSIMDVYGMMEKIGGGG